MPGIEPHVFKCYHMHYGSLTANYRYVAMGAQSAVRFPEQDSLILDCLPYAISTYGVEANLSTIRWFRFSPMQPESVTEIVDNTTMINIFVSGNRERLLIQELTIATGAQEGTEAAYRCQVCRNVVPPEEMRCSQTTTNVTADSEWSHLTCSTAQHIYGWIYFFMLYAMISFLEGCCITESSLIQLF